MILCHQPAVGEIVRRTVADVRRLAPGVTEWYYAIGATVKPSAKGELSLALVDVPNVSVSGPNPLEAPGAQRVTIGIHQFQVEAGYARKY